MFDKEQLRFIKVHMERCIEEVNKDVEKYGWNDEATAGAEDALEMAREVINIIDKKRINILRKLLCKIGIHCGFRYKWWED